MTREASMDGKVALVTGGGSGIGEACCNALARRGCKVVVADLSMAGAERVAGQIEAAGGRAAAVQVDVSKPDSVEAMVSFCTERFGGLDIAVNNAGIGGEQNAVGDMSIEGWQRVIQVNLDSVFYCMHYEIPVLLQRGGGSIVNMASILGSVGFANSAAYVAAKHGVVGLTKSAALEYSARGIRVNSVGPGFIMTPLVTSSLDAATLDLLAGMHAQKRLGSPEEVAALVCFLASDEASFITGSYHLVDGGYTAQ